MVFAIALPVCAETSPGFKYNVETEVVPVGSADVSYVYNEDGTVKLVANVKEGYDFVRWNIVGTYEKISGDETESVMVIKPTTDIKAQAQVNKADDTTTKKPDTQKPDSTTKPTETPKPGTQSPSTGVIPAVFATVMAVSAAGIGISFKKSSKK